MQINHLTTASAVDMPGFIGGTAWNAPHSVIWNGDEVINAATSTFTSATSTAPVLAVNSGGGIAVHAQSTGIAFWGNSTSATEPALTVSSDAYYGGLFYNVTDRGSTGANANCIGLVSQSAYAQSAYFQQGAVSGTGSTLARDNILPSVYVTRVTASLNGHDFTQPLLTVEDTTLGTGGLFTCIRAGSTKFTIDNTGLVRALTALSVGASSGSGAPAATGAVRIANSALIVGRSNAGADKQIATLWSDDTLYLGDVGVNVSPWSGSQNLGSAALGWAGIFASVSMNNVGYYEGTEMATPAAPGLNKGRLYFDDNGSGKTRLMVLFNTGAAQQVAIQP